jgi:hypothetical protein
LQAHETHIVLGDVFSLLGLGLIPFWLKAGPCQWPLLPQWVHPNAICIDALQKHWGAGFAIEKQEHFVMEVVIRKAFE